MGGWPGSEDLCLWACGSLGEYHYGTSRESIERRRVAQVRFVNLGLGVDVPFGGVGDAVGVEALLRQRRFAFYYVQLLSAAAAVEDGARSGPLRERVGEGAERDVI